MKGITLFLTVAVILGGGGVGFADITLQTVDVSLTIPKIISLGTPQIYSAPTNFNPANPEADVKADPITPGKGTTKTATFVDFGELKYDTKYGIWRPENYFAVFLTVTSTYGGYTVQQEYSGGLTENLTMTPGYCSKDKWKYIGPKKTEVEEEQGNIDGSTEKIPGGEENEGVWTGTSMLASSGKQTIFDSGNGKSRIVRAYYGLATGNTDKDKGTVDPEGAKVLTNKDFAAGVYSGKITFTVSPK